MSVPGAAAESARARMLELFPDGFEEVEGSDGSVELVAYAPPEAEERFWAAFGPGRVADVGSGWVDGWKQFHRPVRVGPLWVGPPWLEPDAGTLAVVIDPGRAFGTGAHATTRLCLELLVECEPSGLVDVGCGSGVLAIAAAKLGWAPVWAVDVDAVAVDVARGNARANGIEMRVEQVDLVDGAIPTAPVAVANIARGPVEIAARRVEADRLIASGYLVVERPELPGWTPVERREDGGWAADLFVRTRSP